MKILIVRTGAMGDIIHGMHAVAGLRKAMPHVEIGWVVEPAWEPLLRSASGAMPLVHRIHHAETKAWSRAPFSPSTLQSILKLRRELRAEKYDLCIDLQGSIRSAIIGRMANAPMYVGAANPREKAAHLFYTQRVATTSSHVIEQAAEIISVAVSINIAPEPHLYFPVGSEEEQWCNAILGSDTQLVAMLAPRAGWGAKQWPAERYGAAAFRLAEMGWRVFINAIPHTLERGGDVVAAVVVTASAGNAKVVECTLPQLIALTRRFSLFIGGDTGPLHLAAANTVPCVAIFGPTDPKRTGPWGTNARVLRDTASVTDHRRHANSEGGLLRITVEDVIHATQELVKGREA